MITLYLIAAPIVALTFFGAGVYFGRKNGEKNAEGVCSELRRQIEVTSTTAKELQSKLSEAEVAKARFETEAQSISKQLADEKLLLENTKRELSEHFKAVSAEALKNSNSQFLELAQVSMVEPVKVTLQKFDTKLAELEVKRVGAYEGLVEQVKYLRGSQESLRDQTQNLARALSSPKTRGRWGEIQLKRVVELAGMVNYCDFTEQVSVAADDENSAIRPDLVIRLPGGKQIVVDAKAPLGCYLESLEASDEERRIEKLKAHAKHIEMHVDLLSKKSYWERLSPTPEFVVLFLPSETFFSAALEMQPNLIESSVEQRVIIATPTTLISLLKAVSYGWRQERLAENAQAVCDLGRQLYDRVKTMSDYIGDVGKNLKRAVESYNKSVGNIESRVLSTARKFETLGIAHDGEEIPVIDEIDSFPREHIVKE